MSDSILNKKNDFLYFDNTDSNIKITGQALKFKQVKILTRRDRSMGKKYLQKCIDYCFYINHKDSPISHLSLERKIAEINNLVDNLKDFDASSEYYLDMEKIFIETHYSRVELMYIMVIKDMNNIRESLISMPTVVRKKVVKTIKGVDGEDDHYLEGYIEYDNSVEKAKATNAFINIDKVEKLLRDKVEQEYKEKKSSSRRMFDN